jgi:hypothetical protein
MMILFLLQLATAFDGDIAEAKLPARSSQDDQDSSLLGRRQLVAKADVWFASFEGSGRLNKVFGIDSASEHSAPRMSYNREGHVGGTEPFPELELSLPAEAGSPLFGRYRLLAGYGAWSESGTLDAPLTLAGKTVPVGSAFDSHFNMWDLGVDVVFGRSFVPVPLEISGWLGFHLYHAGFRMWTPAGEISDTAGCIGAETGVHVEYRPISSLFASGEFSFLAGFGVLRSQGMLSTGVVWKGIRLEAGYRHLWAWLDSVIAFRLSMGGPFVGLSYSF